MNIDFFSDFKDPYLQTDEGKGIFLAGITLGILAKSQIATGEPIDSAPLYKQIRFGRLQKRNLMALWAKAPILIRTTLHETKVGYAGMIESLYAKSGELIIRGGETGLGVNGNFAFSVAFLNASDYFFGKIFEKKDNKKDNKQETPNNPGNEGEI
jgi:hypothetical protein